METRYEIGHTFWVPRSVKRVATEKMCFEGETWNREVLKYVAYAKKKEIIGITARVNCYSNVKVLYAIIDYKETHQLSQTYGDNDITNYTEEEALKVAQSYADQGLEFYGIQ